MNNINSNFENVEILGGFSTINYGNSKINLAEIKLITSQIKPETEIFGNEMKIANQIL